MKHKEMIGKEDVIKLISQKASEYMESAVINDHIKADALAELMADITLMDPAAAWISKNEKPPAETLILIRIEYKELDGEVKKFVGTGAYRKGIDGSDKWMRINGKEISPTIITGWQLMPSP